MTQEESDLILAAREHNLAEADVARLEKLHETRESMAWPREDLRTAIHRKHVALGALWEAIRKI